MRKLVLILTALVLGTTGIMASTTDDKVAERNAYRYNKSFIFVENGITFSVYPDGEFDFYVNNRIGNHRRNVTFNSGFDYSPYAQYDDYGAVIQVENVPVYYDGYGRVSQIGNVDINYRNRRVFSVGNMFVYYNRNGFYDYHTGYINNFNRFYVYRPFHRFFARPSLNRCLVFGRPYRRFYNPIRYTYYNPYRFNRRHAYAKIGREHRYNKVRRERSTVYRNDKRVTVRDNKVRSNRTVGRNAVASRINKPVNRANTRRKSTATRSNRSVNGRSTTLRKSNYRKGNTVTNKTSTVKRTPRTNTVTRSTTRTQRSVAKPVQRSRSTASRSVRTSPSRSSRSTVSRSSTSRTVKSTPSRSSRNTRSASSSRSRRALQ